MRVVADLHIHSFASDGLKSPDLVVSEAKRLGLQAISITDHDTVAGVAAAQNAAAGTGVEVIPGVELSTVHNDCEVHILGYNIDICDKHFLSMLQELQQSRQKRAERMVEKLCSMGFPIEMSAVSDIAGCGVPGRPHIARALMAKGMIHSIKQAFEELIGSGGPAYIERFKISPQEAISAVRAAGGFAVLAHPGLCGSPPLSSLLTVGLAGIEVYHPDHNWKQEKYYLALARELGLTVTGGSDFHGNGIGIAARLGVCGLTWKDLLAFKKAL